MVDEDKLLDYLAGLCLVAILAGEINVRKAVVDMVKEMREKNLEE